MAAAVGQDEGVIAAINIMPMVDIMLVLLIIFMLTAKLVDERDAIKVELPEAATGETVEKTVLGLMITPTGDWLLNGEAIDETGLRARARAAKADPAGLDVSAIIAADRAVPHGDVIHLIDVIKQEGITKFALNIDPVPLPPEAPAAP